MALDQIPSELGLAGAYLAPGGMSGSPDLNTLLSSHRSRLAAIQAGVIPSARLNLATNPTADDTVVIGGHTFKFVSALATADTTTQIKIGASAAASRALLVKAINGTADAANIRLATTPFALALKATEVDTSRVLVRTADEQGGTAVAKAKADADIAVSETLTHAADVWDRANLNLTGQAESAGSCGMTSITISAAMITAGKVYVEFPFTPVQFVALCVTSTGAVRSFTDTLTIEGDAVKITLAGGASPNLQANDVVTIYASS